MGSEGSTAKLEVILGTEAVLDLAASTVMVFGLGGVGSNCVVALARGGIGSFILFDRDVVQESNINRQAVAYQSTIGRKKVDVMRDMILDINPSANVVVHDAFILEGNLPEMIDRYRDRVDYVVDAIDTVSAKLAIAQYAQRWGMRLISSMGAANKLHPECFRIADIQETVNCPLSRVIRKEARKRGIEGLRVLYSCEEPVRVAPREGAPRSERSNLGTASFMPPIAGMMIAGEVIRELAASGGEPVPKNGNRRG